MKIIERIAQNTIIDNYLPICDIPKSVKIQLTSVCNLQCNYCYNKYIERQNTFINFNDFKDIIDQLVQLKVKQVGLLFLGQSTLHPQLINCIDYAKNNGIQYLFLTTNGLLIKDKLMKNIANSKLDSLKFSINHFSSYDFYNSTNVDAFNEILTNLKAISKYINQNNLSLNLYASSALYNIDNIPQNIINFIDNNIKPYVKDHYFYKLNNRGGLIKNQYFNLNYCNQTQIPCPKLFNNSYITTDLKVMACCCGFTNKFQIGNLKEKSFQEIWNDQKIVNLRKAHLNNNLEGTICR